jgi:putative MATE family efflux protein
MNGKKLNLGNGATDEPKLVPKSDYGKLTSGSIPQHFRSMAVPMAIGMVFSTLYAVVDTFYAGLISTDTQAGLVIASQVFMLLIALGFGLSTAMGALVGHALGEKMSTDARQLACQGIVFGISASIIISAVGHFYSADILSVISKPGAYQDAAIDYLQLLLFGAIAFILAFGANGILQAQGNMKAMQRAQVWAFFANLGLNPLFIFGIPNIVPVMGFTGIAVSTLVSQSGVLVYVLYRVFKSDLMIGATRALFLPKFKDNMTILTQALPSSFSIIVMMLAGIVVQFFLKEFGANAVAGFGVALRLEQLLLLPAFGLTGSLLPIAAQNFGAGNYDRVREATRYCLKVGCVLMVGAVFIIWLVGGGAISLFTSDPEVIRYGIGYLRVDSIILPVYVALFTINSIFQAFKKPIWTVWIGVYRQGIGVALFSYIGVVYLQLGVFGIWFGIVTSVITGLILSLFLVERIARVEIGGLLFTRHKQS